MIENTSTLYKMIILYMLKKVTFPLSNSQITNFLLDHEYTTYFHIQQTIHDLMDTHLILERKQGNSICYEITPEGQKTLSYFEKNMSDSIRLEVDSYILEKGMVTQLRVRTFPPDEGIVVFGMPNDRRKTGKILDIVQKYYAIASDMKRIGPSSLDICLVASGKAKMYLELDLNLWDISAGILILTEAGGTYVQKGYLYIFGNEYILNIKGAP